MKFVYFLPFVMIDYDFSTKANRKPKQRSRYNFDIEMYAIVIFGSPTQIISTVTKIAP